MKKFKNKISVEGPLTLKEAFIKELLKLGYKLYNDEQEFERWPYLFINGDYGGKIQSADSYCSHTLYTLPAQWNEALTAACEVEEEIPEYVKCTYSQSSNFIEGNIYKVINWDTTGWSLYNEDGTTTSGFFKPNYSKFEISTKAAYDAQQQELADKELLEKLIKESELEIGMSVVGKAKVLYDSNNHSYNIFGNNYIRTVREFKLLNRQLYLFLNDDYNVMFKASDFKSASQPKILTLGSSNIEIKVYKGKIEAAGKKVRYGCITNLVSNMKLQDLSFSHTDWKVSFPSVKIGCSTFTLAELEQIVETYNELNK